MYASALLVIFRKYLMCPLSELQIVVLQSNWLTELQKWPGNGMAADMDVFVKHIEAQVC